MVRSTGYSFEMVFILLVSRSQSVKIDDSLIRAFEIKTKDNSSQALIRVFMGEITLVLMPLQNWNNLVLMY